MIDLQKYQTRLEDLLAIITKDLTTIAKHDPSTDDWEAVPDNTDLDSADINLEADAVESWNERRATVSALEIEYRDIKRALQKIATGTYGICEISGEPIEEKRLEAKPTARTNMAHLDAEGQLPL
jgi:RNA polymerase-binding transcription factor DksA